MPYDAPDLFGCTRCGACCKGYGGTFVTEQDIRRIAAYANVNPDDFKNAFCQKAGEKWMIGQGADGFCVFWDRRCRIHPVKPLMCRSWPYLESVLWDFSNWRIMASSCPGIRADAPEHRVKAHVEKVLNGISSGRPAQCGLTHP